MFNTIKCDLTNAMKEKDKFKLDCIRMLKSSLQMEEINLKHELTDDEVLAVIKREVKKRNSSIEEYKKYGKDDVVASLQKEIDILSVYLPEELSEDELMKIIEETIKQEEATSIKEMGKVVKTIGNNYGAQVDMAKVSRIVKEKLS